MFFSCHHSLHFLFSKDFQNPLDCSIPIVCMHLWTSVIPPLSSFSEALLPFSSLSLSFSLSIFIQTRRALTRRIFMGWWMNLKMKKWPNNLNACALNKKKLQILRSLSLTNSITTLYISSIFKINFLLYQ